MEIKFEPIIAGAAPALQVVTIEATVKNSPTTDELWSMIERAAADLREVTELADINKRPAIRATREAYKACGKEPNRYRPSSEALSRRAVKGVGALPYQYPCRSYKSCFTAVWLFDRRFRCRQD